MSELRAWTVALVLPIRTAYANMLRVAMKSASFVLLIACAGTLSGAAAPLKLSTTTSTQDAGILDVLLPPSKRSATAELTS